MMRFPAWGSRRFCPRPEASVRIDNIHAGNAWIWTGGPPRIKMGDPPGEAIGIRAWYGLRTRYSKCQRTVKPCSSNTLRRGRSAFVLHLEKYFRGRQRGWNWFTRAKLWHGESGVDV